MRAMVAAWITVVRCNHAHTHAHFNHHRNCLGDWLRELKNINTCQPPCHGNGTPRPHPEDVRTPADEHGHHALHLVAQCAFIAVLKPANRATLPAHTVRRHTILKCAMRNTREAAHKARCSRRAACTQSSPCPAPMP